MQPADIGLALGGLTVVIALLGLAQMVGGFQHKLLGRCLGITAAGSFVVCSFFFLPRRGAWAAASVTAAIVFCFVVSWLRRLRRVDSDKENVQQGQSADPQPFVERTPEELLGFYKGATGLQGDKRIAPYKGFWIKVTGRVVLLLPDNAGFVVVLKTPSGAMIESRFVDQRWSAEFGRTNNDDLLTIQGKISPDQNGQQLYLKECELAGGSKESTGGTPPHPQPQPPKKPIDIWLAIAAVVIGIVLYMLPKTGAAVVVLLFLIFALMIHPIWNFWWIEHATWRRISSLGFLLLALVWFGLISWPTPGTGTLPQMSGNTSETARPQNSVPCEPHDVQYVPPKGKAIRFEGMTPIASEALCPSNGMSDEARIACLCPNRVPYSLRAMPPPAGSNFETEITITKVCNPMYKIRVFLRDVYTQLGSVSEASPYMPPASHVSIMYGTFDFDRHSFLVSSSAPEDTFKVSVLTATGLRVICVNQEN